MSPTGGVSTSDFWPCARRKWVHCVSGFRGGHPGKRAMRGSVTSSRLDHPTALDDNATDPRDADTSGSDIAAAEPWIRDFQPRSTRTRSRHHRRPEAASRSTIGWIKHRGDEASSPRDIFVILSLRCVVLVSKMIFFVREDPAVCTRVSRAPCEAGLLVKCSRCSERNIVCITLGNKKGRSPTTLASSARSETVFRRENRR